MKPWLKEEWCIPQVGSEFVWHMEDLLDLYEEPLSEEEYRRLRDLLEQARKGESK